MMMLPDGWVTDIITNRAASLRALGNGVVPPQAAYALRSLLDAVDFDRTWFEPTTVDVPTGEWL